MDRFLKKNDSIYQESLLEYLPAVSEPPKYPVCKRFLDDLLQLIEDLELGHIFAHGDEQVYAQLAHIWKDHKIYQNAIILMGGIHQLRVRQKTIHKRHAVKEYQAWCTNSNIIATGSSDSVIEGRHYYRSMRIHKEMFCALVQQRVEEITDNYKNLDDNSKELFRLLKSFPCKENVEAILNKKDFNDLYDVRAKWHRIQDDNSIFKRCFITVSSCCSST